MLSQAIEVLFCFIYYFDKMQVEKLIKELPSVPFDWSNGYVNSATRDHLSNGISSQQAENSTSLRETQSMLLERIASEMNRLRFYMAHGQVYFLHSQVIISCFCSFTLLPLFDYDGENRIRLMVMI